MPRPDVSPEALRRTVPVLGGLRLVFGAFMVCAPRPVARGLGLPPEAAMAVQMAGGRELALGIGAIEAWRRGQTTYGWVAAQAVSDAGDTAAFAHAARTGTLSRRRGYGLALFAFGGVATEAATAYLLRRTKS